MLDNFQKVQFDLSAVIGKINQSRNKVMFECVAEDKVFTNEL